MAALFVLGSLCFVVGPFPGYARLVGVQADAWITCSVYLPRCVAVPVPSRSKKRVGKTTVPVSTAFTVPLNGVSAAAALTATLASDTAKAATSPTNSGWRIFIPFSLEKRSAAELTNVCART